MHKNNFLQNWLLVSYINIQQGFPSHYFSRIYCCFHNSVFCIDLFPLIKDDILALDSIATYCSKVDNEGRVDPCLNCGQQVVGLALFHRVNRRQGNVGGCRDEQRDRLLSFTEDMVICKTNVARQQSIRLAEVNREMKTITVSLQVTFHFGFLCIMPMATDLPVAIQCLS